jgi:hypothetical protein
MARGHEEFVTKRDAPRESRHDDLRQTATRSAPRPSHRSVGGGSGSHDVIRPVARSPTTRLCGIESSIEDITTDGVDRGHDDEHCASECHGDGSTQPSPYPGGLAARKLTIRWCDDRGNTSGHPAKTSPMARKNTRCDDRVGKEAGAITHDASAGVGEADSAVHAESQSAR